jgi:hypothetical protein
MELRVGSRVRASNPGSCLRAEQVPRWWDGLQIQEQRDMASTSYSQGHLLVAAIRVSEHLHQHPPQEQEISDLLGWPLEKTAFLLRGLVEDGILARVGTAYEERYEIRDHGKLELLPEDDVDLGIAADIKAFEEKKAQDQAKLANLFTDGDEPEKKKRIKDLDQDFQRFRGGKPRNPFGDD